MNEEATEVWAGNLSDNSVAVLLLNKGSLSNEVEIKWKEIGFNNTEFEIRDLWERKNLFKFKNGYKITLESHSSQLLKIFPIEPDKSKNKNTLIIFVIIVVIIIIIFIIVFIVIKKRSKTSNTIDSELNTVNSNLLNDTN